MADVFLSYARSNLGSARRVADALSAAGFSVWFDESLPVHRTYADVIEERLEGAGAVLVLWSRDSTRSQWVRSEANRARETARLVQARLDDARLPMPFDQIQCADLAGWRGNRAEPGWQIVEASIRALADPDRPAPTVIPPRPAISRRALVIGGGAVLALGGGLAWSLREPPLSPEAQLLLQKGLDALQSNDALDPEDEGSTAQAIALLTQATRAAPRSAVAWGGLALAYAARKRAAPIDERPGLESRGLAAAETALAIKSNEPRALAARQLMRPLYRNWQTAERDARRALALNPTFPILQFVLSEILGNVGRWRDAAQLSSRMDRSRFLLPGADRKVIVNLWSAGDLQAADDALKTAAERWPKHRQVWRTQIAYLLYSGQPEEALAILRDSRRQPPELPPGLVETATSTAEALSGRIPAGRAVAANLAYANSNPAAALPVAQACAALGDDGTAKQLLQGYYFGEGDWASLAPSGGDHSRTTAPLFQPPMRSMWATADFAALVKRIGLEDYWARSGTRPDYRA